MLTINKSRTHVEYKSSIYGICIKLSIDQDHSPIESEEALLEFYCGLIGNQFTSQPQQITDNLIQQQSTK